MAKFLIRAAIGAIPIFTLVFILGGVKYVQIKAAIAQGKTMGPPPTSVTTLTVKPAPWSKIIRSVGSIEASQGSMLSAEAAGRIDSIPINDGSSIKAGDLIIGLDASVELAEYRAAKAQADLLKKTFDRQEKLYKANVVSDEEFDTAQLNYKASLAASEAIMARVLKKQIKAPFDGVTGVRRVNVGEYVKEGDALIPLYNLEQLYFSFSLSQDDVAKIKLGDKATVIVKGLNITVPATISAIDPSISPNTKVAQVRATLEDSDIKLIPGMFAAIEIMLPLEEPVLVIPSTAIQYAPYGDSVFVIEKKISEDAVNTAAEETLIVNPTFVGISDRRGDMVAIGKGIPDGAQIVTSGTFKLYPGAVVTINNEIAPDMNLDPKPANR